jgi:uncharacterized membrane protein
MLTMYLVLKVVHVFAAIVALGANITYGVWIGRARRDPAALSFALRGVKFLDDRVANPGYGLLVLTGFAMVGVSKTPLTTPWILTSIGLVLVVFAVALFGYTPTLRRQIETLARTGDGSPEYLALAARGTRLGAVLACLWSRSSSSWWSNLHFGEAEVREL